MGRVFLSIYVMLNLIILILNVITNIVTDETVHFLDKHDWLIFIIACGALAISEALGEMSK